MKTYLRLVKHLIRYKGRSTFGFQLGALLPIAEVLLDEDFDATEFVEKLTGTGTDSTVAAEVSETPESAAESLEVEGVFGLKDRLRAFVARFWSTAAGQRAATFLIETVFADRARAFVCVGCFVIIVTTLGGIFRFLQQYHSRYIATRLIIDVRNLMYRRAIRFSLSFFDRVTVGATISRFTNDVKLVNQGIVSLFSSVVSLPLRIMVGLGIAFFINAKLATIGLILFPIAGFTFGYFGRRIRRATKRALSRQASILTLLNETFGGIRIVKAFSMEPYEIGRFEKENRRLFRYFMKIAVADEMVKPLMEVIGVVTVVCFVTVGARQVLAGAMPLPEFLVFNGALISVYEPVKKLAKVFTNIQKGIASGERVFEIIDCDESIEERPDAIELPPFSRTIRFRNVSFSYNHGEDVLNGLNLDIQIGEMVAIVGASGAGKTTLVNLVPRFYDVTDGSVTIDGIDLRDVGLRSLRKQIAVVTQEGRRAFQRYGAEQHRLWPRGMQR